MKCEFSVLRTLVQQTKEPGVEVDAVSEHIESCEACRTELEKLGGGADWWDEAGRWLAMDPAECGDSEADALNQHAIDLSFLAPPTHPEMLGRIGQYDVESLLGHGGMGIVFRAHDSDLQRTVAVKVLAPQWATSPLARQRFAREAEAAASVAHENVIPIYNVNATAKLPYLVMRYIPGMTLQRWVLTHGPLDVGTILRVAGQVVEGLAAAHRRGLVHRDIKPGNILVGENIQRVWITDFGLARAADSMMLTRTGVIAGTPHYMSPEQARGKPIDHRSDLFSLGCVLYFLCTGKPPFEADNTLAVLHKIVSEKAKPLDQQRGDLPPSFVRLVQDLLQHSIDRRPQDCQAVIDQLSRAQSEYQRGQTKNPRSKQHLVASSAVLAGLVFVVFCINYWKPTSRSIVPPSRSFVGSASQSYVAGPGSGSVRRAADNRELDLAVERIVASAREQQFAQSLDGLRVQFTAVAATNVDFGNDVFDLDQKHWESSVASMRTEVALLNELRFPQMEVLETNETKWRERRDEIEAAMRRARAMDQ